MSLKGLAIILATLAVSCGDFSDQKDYVKGSAGHYVIDKKDFSDARVIGSSNHVTVKRGSKIKRLIVSGSANEVTIETSVRIQSIELKGSSNTVHYPKNLVCTKRMSGSGNLFLSY